MDKRKIGQKKKGKITWGQKDKRTKYLSSKVLQIIFKMFCCILGMYIVVLLQPNQEYISLGNKKNINTNLTKYIHWQYQKCKQMLFFFSRIVFFLLGQRSKPSARAGRKPMQWIITSSVIKWPLGNPLAEQSLGLGLFHPLSTFQ